MTKMETPTPRPHYYIEAARRGLVGASIFLIRGIPQMLPERVDTIFSSHARKTQLLGLSTQIMRLVRSENTVV